MTTISQLRAKGRHLLKQAQIESHGIDTDVLLMHVLDINKNTLLTEANRAVSDDCANEFLGLIAVRSGHAPIQYLTGKCEFMSLEFAVSPVVLIPRPDTEILVETILTAEKEENTRGLEIGAGSGCISISLEYYGNNITMWGADIKPDAVKVAAQNYKRIFSRDGVFIISDLFQNVPRGTLFNFIVSNPPYIETREIEQLDRCIRDYEPRIALDGGADGLDFYRKIVGQAGEYLKHDGRIYFEIGYNQAGAVKEILAAAGYVDIVILNDYAGKNRVIHARRVKNV
jgi:release factor glutamine methyltransferase